MTFNHQKPCTCPVCERGSYSHDQICIDDYVCIDCGAIVHDEQLHEQFHRKPNPVEE